MSSRLVLLLAGSLLCSAVELPSCESDTDAHCVGEGADLSSEGIAACLQKLADDVRSQRCSNYMKLMAACEPDISGRGVCASAARDGEAVPCLVQRTPADQLTSASGLQVRRLNERETGGGLVLSRAGGVAGAADEIVRWQCNSHRQLARRPASRLLVHTQGRLRRSAA